MSTLNGHLPQTYSRLFRPWDCNTHTSPANQTVSNVENVSNKSSVKSEISPGSDNVSAANTSIVKTENTSFGDRECVSSSSSSTKSSGFEDSYNSSTQMEWSPASPYVANNVLHHVPYTTNAHLYGSLENQTPNLASYHAHPAHAAGMTHLMPSMPTASASDLYYAAAAAAAANRLPQVPAAGSSAAAAAAAVYALDPYALSLMEQEYARVMAEDAQLKAVNARKQRPKKFKCPHCNVAFSNNGQLKGHIRIHTGERPFKCDVETCGKTFTRNEELTRHKRIHTGLKPYPCSICRKKFGRRDHLKKHMKTHLPQERQVPATILVPLYPYIYGYAPEKPTSAKQNWSWSP